VLVYVVRRLLYAVPILLGITIVTFVLFNVVSEDPALVLAGKNATPQKIQELREYFGTDKPKFDQYVQFLKQTVTLDFGESWVTKRRVSSMIESGIGPSLSLALPAFLLETLLAVSLALFCAFYKDSLADRLTVVVAVAMMSVPSLAYILFGQYFVAYQWKMFPIFGYEALPAGIVFLGLPILIWIALGIGSEVRFYRTVVLEEMQQDYVRTAAAKGLHARSILFKHILKNSMIPIITRVVITIPFLITGSLLLERFFGIPGLGSITIDALNHDDFPVIKAMVVFGSILYIVFSLLTDVCYALVDPRVRLR
jgi:peptide/nickel transport system permease protein